MFLHMWKYVADKAYEDTVFDNKHKRNTRKSYDQYKKEYIDEQNRKYEEQRRRDEEERRRRQEYENERWRQIFEEYFERAGRNAGGYQGGSQGSNNGGYRPGGGYNPFPQFKQQYESACDVLGVPYSADYSQIKSAYRKLAKKYHPDLSTENNAEEMFKKINNAFEFLSEENVRRYKSI